MIGCHQPLKTARMPNLSSRPTAKRKVMASNYLSPEQVFRGISALRRAVQGCPEPLSVRLARTYRTEQDEPDSFVLLISCLLSLRTRDSVTHGVTTRLFARIRTPEELIMLDQHELENILYPVGFYRKKAATLRHIAHELVSRFHGRVPGNELDLLSLRGVGRKTAQLVLAEAFGLPALAVDTHVHRLANQLGFVTTTTPHATEVALKKLIEPDLWCEFHRLLVTCGQQRCVVDKFL